jgi:hypothetical protein
LLLISPSQQQQQQQQQQQRLKQQQSTPPPKISTDASKSSEQEELEDDDDTAELLTALSNVAAEGVSGAAASTDPDAITNIWAPQIPRIVKAVGIGAGLAATVPAASALQRRMSKKSGGETSSPPASSTTEAEKEGSNSAGGIGGLLRWAFGEDELENQPLTSSSAPVNTVSDRGDAQNFSAAAGAVVQREETSAPSNGDQVLWRRKDDSDFKKASPLNGSSSSNGTGNGSVLWRRNNELDAKEDRETISNGIVNHVNGALDQQQDLWRMPLESLRSPTSKEDAQDRPTNVTIKPAAPLPQPVPVVEKNKIVKGFSPGVGPPKLSESALDNAEPPDFVANGVHKL